MLEQVNTIVIRSLNLQTKRWIVQKVRSNLSPGLSEDQAVNDDEGGKAKGHNKAHFRGNMGNAVHG